MAWKELTKEDVIENIKAEINNNTDMNKGIIDCAIDLEAGVVRLRARVNDQMYQGTGDTKSDAIDDVVAQVMGGMRR